MRAWNSTLHTSRQGKPRRTSQEPSKGLGASVLHRNVFRSSDMLQLASKAPCCMHCGVANRGQVVGCHPNGLHYGKSTGSKAHDLVTYFCDACHSILDGRAGSLTRAEKELMFLRGFYNSMVWLVQNGYMGAKYDSAA